MKLKTLFLILIFPCLSYAQEDVKEIAIQTKAITNLHIKGYPDFLVSDKDGVWVTNEDRVEKLVWNKKEPVLFLNIPQPCGVMCMAYKSLWVASCKNKSIYRIHSQTGRIEAMIETGLADGEGELSISAGAGSICVLTNSNGELSRIDPLVNKVIAKIPVESNSYAVAFGFGNVWITNTSRSTVQCVDPKSNAVKATIPVGRQPRFLAAGLGAVWTLNQEDGTVTRIDPSSHLTTSIDAKVEGSGGDITVGSKYVYVRAKKTLLSVIDPVTLKIIKRYGPPAGSGAVSVENERVWLTAHDINAIWILKE